MTIDETIEQLDSVIDTYEILLGNGVNSDILDVDDLEAIKVAIASLEAWEKVRQEIGKLSLSWEYGQGVVDCLAIIDHYMQEVGNGQTE